ncbi:MULTISPECIES: TIGR01620 family protein [Rhodomicrobium]|uniref:YcjF family protein n=1 Tax=Rhodomicrobium TaxID=1068 RepID=UPI000B4A57AD|nr:MULTISPECIES: TIGR01620 family protein [Rhodomicrobium]
MTGPDQPRKPAVFRLDDSRLGPLETALPEPLPADAPPPEEQPGTTSALRAMMGWRRGIGWGGIFFSALSGLISLALGIWAYKFIIDLFASGGWIGYLALACALIAAFAGLMIAGREVLGFFRLGRVAAIRLKADSALTQADKALATDVSHGIERLFSGRAELKWGARRLADHRREVLDARELLILTEREMLRPLDIQANGIIGATVRRVALITAISPSAIIDVGFVAVANLSMLRRLATLYGGRPGFLGSLRLARLVLGHLAVTGGVALGDDLIQQFIGHGLTARLSAKLGEGVMNGAFTGRIGIAAVDLCRPLPYIEAERPRLRDFLAELRLRGKGQTTPAKPGVTDE